MIKLNQIQDKNTHYILGLMQELVIALVMNGINFDYHEDSVVVGKYTMSPVDTGEGTYIEVHRKYDLIREVYTEDDIDSLVVWLFYQ